MHDMIVKDVDVMGDLITAAKDPHGNIWVGVRWICDALDMTEGQMKRQITNIKKDMVFSRGGSNQIPLPTGNNIQEVFCIRNDFIPLWLAKINITEKTRQERPEFADKLLEYQLKAKDILAAAFTPNKEMPQTVQGQIQLLAQGNVELNKRVDEVTEDVKAVKQEIESLKLDLPILPIEADKITEAVRKKGVATLGGKRSQAYNNRNLRQKLYNNLYANLKYNFGVKSYKSIKRSQCDKAIEIIHRYEPPFFLAQMIENENAQQALNLEGGAK